ncbi:RNA polymerase II-associated protein 1 isoform X2 [Bombina bombina]|nr:RNA polymerase II-associated protein 1 isoform X2 [Bombina bombina]XP_053553791.1 RNA polymerase II-associated protein 1 isoform X2 [Bombina bombina]XP_053553792.1 RNA polymerase II-associated protein 1 isoform X2 [Bombina bombina]XP_053553793.1 RNA polymerase II-associated protein 1 isoform X2 [Bombina bombina]
MLSRPKPGESEEDLLKFQNQFIAAGGSAAAKVFRKADKRKGDAEEKAKDTCGESGSRDVVTLQDFPDLPPILTPGPSKKSKFAKERVHFADEDPEEILDRQDQHITAVFSKIIERDTSSATITAPMSTGQAFPQVFHRSQIQSQEAAGPGKISIFAQKMAAKKVAEAAATNAKSITMVTRNITYSSHEIDHSCDDITKPTSTELTEEMHVDFSHRITGDSSHLITGEGLQRPDSHEEAQRIHKENVEKLKAMSKEEILHERDQLLSQLDSKLVAFLKSQRAKKPAQDDSSTKNTSEECHPVKLENPDFNAFGQAAQDGATKKEAMSVDELPVKPQKEWLHMDNVEFEKLEWTKNLPKLRQTKTKKGMQARFDLKGELIPPNTELPTHLGLHHHGEESERAGYSLQELFHLSRSQFIQQRALSQQVLGRIVQKARQGEFSSSLKGSVLRLLLDAGFLFLLRYSIDDSAENVIAASVHSLYSLLVSPDDEDYLDMTFSWYQGTNVFPFIPTQDEEDEDDDDEEEAMLWEAGKEERKKAKEEKKSDPDVARYDAVKGLLKTKVLHRLRYILEVVRPSPSVVLDILSILTRVARHSTEACIQLLDCPRLMETVIKEFLPIQWTMHVDSETLGPSSLHGIPSSSAMKLLRVLATSGRHACARLLNKFDMKNHISRFVAQEPQDLSLPREEAERLITETFRLWAVAAGYGQACDLYRELYPVLVKILQSLPHLIGGCKVENYTHHLIFQRMAAVVILLTHVTQTAGCTAELEAQLRSSAAEVDQQIPPPPVSWCHVTGLVPLVEGCLRRCLQEVSSANVWEIVQPLTIACINFLASFYQAASRQPSVNPVTCNEDVERLASDVLLPFLQHTTTQSMWDLLRSCSSVCNPLSCSPLPESVPSIVSLSCEGGKPPLSLAGKKSPFPILTALLNLISCITNIHKGLISKFSIIHESKGLHNYLVQVSTAAPPAVTPSTIWLLRHEYHLQYFVLSLVHKMAMTCPDYSQNASLYHSMSLTLLSGLLPGSEQLAHKTISSFVFNPLFLQEGRAGGPEAADLSDILHISGDAKITALGSAAMNSVSPSRGVLLEEAYKNLSSIQSCYLAHFTNMEQALDRSKCRYQGRTCFVQSAMLPEARGPVLPSDWPFLPLITLYNKVTNAETRGHVLNTLPPDLVSMISRSLQWILLLETWRPTCLHSIPIAAKLTRLACVFLTGGDLFLEGLVHAYTAALLVIYCQPKYMDSLKLDVPLPGLASFYDFYMDLLEQFEAVSFGDPLFGSFVLLPLQRRFSVQLKRAVFGENVSSLRSLSVHLKEFPLSLDLYTSPPEDNLTLLRLYFRTLLTRALRQTWCPVLYIVAVAHVNSFIFSQDRVTQEMDSARKSMLRKTYLLTDEVLRNHLLYFKQISSDSPVGFDLYDQLPPLRQKYLKAVTEKSDRVSEKCTRS